MTSHHHRHHSHAAHDRAESSGLADVLDLDAQVLAEAMDGVRAAIAALTDAPVRTVLDLGAGTGTGTFGLLDRFPGARAVAVDASEEMLDRVRTGARERGVEHRLTTVRADLDSGVPVGEPVDLVWAAGSLHHLTDPDRILGQVVEALRAGGLLAVVELVGHPRFVPEGAAGAAAESRAHALLGHDRTVDMPAMGSDWASRLTAAGLVVELSRPVAVDLTGPASPLVGRYAFEVLSRVRAAVAGRLEPEEEQQLARLVDGGPDDVRRRSDLHVRTVRELVVARRPAG